MIVQPICFYLQKAQTLNRFLKFPLTVLFPAMAAAGVSSPGKTQW